VLTGLQLQNIALIERSSWSSDRVSRCSPVRQVQESRSFSMPLMPCWVALQGAAGRGWCAGVIERSIEASFQLTPLRGVGLRASDWIETEESFCQPGVATSGRNVESAVQG
jgi:hypothetical protein